MNVTELVERVREILGEVPQLATAKRQWTDGELLRHINSAYDTVWKRARQADENWGLDFADGMFFGATVAEFSGLLQGILFNIDVHDIVRIEENVGPTEPGVEWMKCELRSATEHMPTYYPMYENRRGWFPAGQANGIIVTKTNQPIDLSRMRIWFLRRAPRLVRFQAQAHPTTSVLRTSVTVPGPTQLGTLNTIRNYYRNCRVECVAALNPGATPQRLTFQCAGWDLATHPNFDMTFSTPHGMAAGTSTWEVLPMFPEEHHELIAWLGARRALARGGDSKQRDVIMLEEQELYRDLIEGIEHRQIQFPREVTWEG